MKRTVDIYKPTKKPIKGTKSQTLYDAKNIAKLKSSPKSPITTLSRIYVSNRKPVPSSSRPISLNYVNPDQQLLKLNINKVSFSQLEIARPYESLQPKKQSLYDSTFNLIKQHANQKPKPNQEKRTLWHNFLNNSNIDNQRRAQSSSTQHMRQEPKSEAKYRSAQSLHKNPDFLQFKLSFSVRTRQGQLASNPNKTNQDIFICETNIISDTHLFSVCDGHGQNGHFVSQFIRDQFSRILKKETCLRSNPRQAVAKTIQLMAHSVNRQSFDTQFSGTTMNTILIQDGGRLLCANLGDSRAILGRIASQSKFKPFPLSIDHKPCLEKEMHRIHQHGGRVETYYDDRGKTSNSLGNPIGPARVWVKEGNYPGLAMSRSLGDQIAQSVGVSSVPEIFEYQLTPQDRFIVIGTDGVWEFIDNQSVVDIVGKYYLQGDLEGACDELMHISYRMWTLEDDSVVDDITLIVIFIS